MKPQLLKALTAILFIAAPDVSMAAPEKTASIPPEAGKFFAHIRQGNIAAIREQLKDPAALEWKDEDGNSSLMQAAFYLDASAVELFLAKGANPNATNHSGATPLMFGADDAAKVKLLLKHGASAKAVSEGGNTALLVASQRLGCADILKELLAHGADVRAVNRDGDDALRACARTGDVDALRLLLDHGADVQLKGRTPYSATAEISPLMVAAQFGHMDCVRLLLERGADARFTSESGNALHFATFTDRHDIARLLLDRGVDVNVPGKRLVSFRNDPGLTSLMYAAMSERNDPSLVEWLIGRGASVNARSASGETPLSIARQRGKTRIVAALEAAGATSPEPAAHPVVPTAWTDQDISQPAVPRKAVESALKVLLESGARFTEETANRCFSCHQHSQPAMAIGLARQKNFSYDQTLAQAQLEASLRTAGRRKSAALEAPLPVPSIAAWFLIGLQASDYPADKLTDAYVFSLARSQSQDGRWITKAWRPPTDYSDITTTALAIRALKVYAPPTMKTAFDKRISDAAAWLRAVRPLSTEERAMQLLGLRWAGVETATLEPLARDLLKDQRPDGGWAQLSTLESDAYATGLALNALNQSAALPATHENYQRGTRFLLKHQAQDGSWRVPTRASPVQVAIDDIFSHSKDQWISSAATAWASMALMLDSSKTDR